MHVHSADRYDSPGRSLFDDAGVTYRSPRLLAKLVTAMFVLDLAGLVMSALLLWDSLGIAQALAAGQEVSQESFAMLERRASEIAQISWALLMGCTFLFGLWTYLVARNVAALGGHLSVAPGWAVGYYFVPILSMWRPYSVMAEVWDASDPDPRAATYAPRSHALLLFWWIVWLTSAWVDLLAFRSRAPEDARAWAAQIGTGFVYVAVEALAVALIVAVVWKLSRRQDERAAALMPVARIA
jgi:hypothetical protein